MATLSSPRAPRRAMRPLCLSKLTGVSAQGNPPLAEGWQTQACVPFAVVELDLDRATDGTGCGRELRGLASCSISSTLGASARTALNRMHDMRDARRRLCGLARRLGLRLRRCSWLPCLRGPEQRAELRDSRCGREHRAAQDPQGRIVHRLECPHPTQPGSTVRGFGHPAGGGWPRSPVARRSKPPLGGPRREELVA